jgi:hypothetical protein
MGQDISVDAIFIMSVIALYAVTHWIVWRSSMAAACVVGS